MCCRFGLKHFIALKTVVFVYSCLAIIVTPAMAFASGLDCHGLYLKTQIDQSENISPIISYFESLNIQIQTGSMLTIQLPLIRDLPAQLQVQSKDAKEAVGHISYQFADFRNTHLEVGLVRVNKLYRKQGIADFLYRKMLEKNPQTKTISCSLADVNLEVMVNVLISALSSHRSFNQRALEQYKRNAESEYRNSKRENGVVYHSEEMFDACCSMISLRDYPVGLVERALRTTPSFRVTEKLGFNKIKEIKFNPISLSTYDVEFTVERGN